MEPITANSVEGRILLALRPGGMDAIQMAERLPGSGSLLWRLTKAGLITRTEKYYEITAAGLAACPKRRDVKRDPLHANSTSFSRMRGWSKIGQQGATA